MKAGIFRLLMIGVGAIIVSITTLAPGAALAQGRTPNSVIKKFDQNGDGILDSKEWTRRNFKQIDQDKDGFLTTDEFAAHFGNKNAAPTGMAGGGRSCPEQPVANSGSPYVIEANKPACVFAGTTLFAEESNPNRPMIVEIDMNGAVVWKHNPGSGSMNLCIGSQCKSTNGPFSPMDVARLENGNTLYVVRGVGLFEVNRAGKTVWKHRDYQASHDVDRLPNGNTLYVRGFVAKGQDHIREITPDGKTVWSWNGLKQYDRKPYASIKYEGWMHLNAVTRMPNGNTWMSNRNFDLFTEIDRAGNIVTEVKLPLPGVPITAAVKKFTKKFFHTAAPHDPEVQANGNLLIPLSSMGGTLIETDPTGTKLLLMKRYTRNDGIFHIRDANRLPNGNILLTSALRLVEINAEGQTVWQMFHSKIKKKKGDGSNHLFKAIRIAPDGTAYGG